MGDRRASLFVSVEGWQEAAQAAEKVNSAWVSAGHGIGSAFSKVGEVAGNAVTGMISDVTRLLTASQGINFAKGVSEARAWSEAVGRMAIAGKVSVATLDRTFEGLSKKKLVPEKEILSFTNSVRRMTYDTQGAIDAFGGLADEATATGKSANEMVPLAVFLHNTLGITGDATTALGRMRKQADMLGTTGGPAALQDQLASVGKLLHNMTTGGGNKLAGRVTAMVAGFGGPNLNPEQREEATSGVLGKVMNDPMWLKVFLGKRLSTYQDKEGRIKDPLKLVEDIQKKWLKQYGHGEGSALKAQLTFGSLGGMALLNTDFGAIEKAAVAKPSTAAAQKMVDFASTPAGRQLAAQQAKDREEKKLGAQLNPTITATQQLMANHPILGTLGLGIGGQIFGQLTGGIIKSAFGAAGAGGGAAGGGGWLGSALASPIGGAALLMGGVMAVNSYQQSKNQETIDKYNEAHPVDEGASQFFGTEYARSHKATMRRGGMQVAEESTDALAQLGGYGDMTGSTSGGNEGGPVEIGNVKDLAAAIADAMRSRPITINATSDVPGVSISVDGQLAGTPRQ